MRTLWTKAATLLFLCSLVLLTGCLVEDAVTVTKDGKISFESLITEPDDGKKIDFAAFEQGIAKIAEDLKERKWKVEAKWLSKDRPYRVKLSGSGKLSEVTGTTPYYSLWKVEGKKFKVNLYPQQGTAIRVGFSSPDQGVLFVDAGGKPVQEIERATANDVVTIILP